MDTSARCTSPRYSSALWGTSRSFRTFAIFIVISLCTAAVSASASNISAAPDFRPGIEAKDSVSSWHVALGGFSGLRGIDSARVSRIASDGTEEISELTWAVDPHRVGGGVTAARDLTAMVRIEDGLARMVSVVDGALLNALSIADGAGDVGFAVGAEGAIARLAGDRWLQVSSPTDATLVAVDLFARDAGWAVGSRSTILRWDGLRWSLEATPEEIGTSASIVDVTSVSRETAWAVTRDGRILERSASGWRVHSEAPRTPGLSNIAFNGPDHGLAVGSGVLEYRGGTWSALAVPAGEYGDVEFAGGIGYALLEGSAHRIMGSRLEAIEDAGSDTLLDRTPIDHLVAFAPERTSLIAVGRVGVMAKISGLSMDQMWPPLTGSTSLSVAADDFGWIGGDAQMAGLVGTAEGEAWSRREIVVGGVTVTDVETSSSGVAWAAGHRRTVVEGVSEFVDMAWRWDGTEWTSADPPPSTRFDGIVAVSRDEAWSTRGETINRWDGESWGEIEGAPDGAGFGDAHIVRGGSDPSAWEGWFGGVGEVHRLSGGEWSKKPVPADGIVTVIQMPAEDDGWAIAGGRLFHYDGTDWNAAEPPLASGSELLDVAAPGKDDAWLLADLDGLLHWDGVRWRRQGLGSLDDQASFSRLSVIRPDADQLSPAVDVWLLGSPLTVARFRVVVPSSRLVLPWLDVGRR